MKYFESGKINVYPAGFRSANYKQSKLTTEENITHLQNFMSTSDGLYIDYIDYSKNHTSNDPSVVQITNKNAGAYFYIAGTEAKVYINSKSEISVNNDYFILRVCGYSFRFKIIDFLNLCLLASSNSPSLSGKDVYGYIYLRNSGSGPIGYVLGNVSTPSENVLDQGILFQGLGIGSNSEGEQFNDCYKVKIGKFDLVASVNRFTISYDPIQVVNATADESGNNIKATYAHSLIKTEAADPNTSGDTLSLKNNLNQNLPESSLSSFEIVNAKHAASSNKLDDAPSLSASASNNNRITVTAGGQTSNAFTVPYATKATNVNLSCSGSGTNSISIQAGSGTKASFTINNVTNAASATNSDFANKIKTSSKIGDVNNPVYVASDGTVTAGNFIPKLNGNEQAAANPFYAPELAGTAGQVLKSKGSGAPEWINQSELFVGSATKDANGNIITSTYAHSLTATDATHTTDVKIYLNANDDDSNPTPLSDPSLLNTVKKSIISEIKNGRLEIKKINDDKGYNVYTADLYGLNRLEPGTFLTVYLAANNTSDKPVKFKLNTSQTAHLTKEVYLNGKACSSTNKLGLDDWGTFYNAYYTGTNWNFTPIGEIISGTSVTLNGNDKQGKYINIYAPDEAGTKGAILLSDGPGINKAPVWSNTSKGSSEIKPLYLDSKGVLSVGSQYAGGTKVKLNGADKGTSIASFYASTDPGETGQVLTSTGGGDPVWINQKQLSVLSATTAINANNIRVEAGSGAGTTGYKSIKSVTSLPTSPDANTLYIIVEEA